jgi:hypothetical protein
MSSSSQLRFRPGDHKNDNRYLFEGHYDVLTQLEKRAWRRLLMLEKIASTSNPTQRDLMTRKWLDTDEAVTRLLQLGEHRFFAATFERVLREQPDRLRTCPHCGSLCRTSAACLCPHCSHTWYEERQNKPTA